MAYSMAKRDVVGFGMACREGCDMKWYGKLWFDLGRNWVAVFALY